MQMKSNTIFYPNQWRLGQFLSNFISWCRTKKLIDDIFYIEDDQLKELMAEFASLFPSV